MTTAQIAAEELGASQIQAQPDDVPASEDATDSTAAGTQSVWQPPTYSFSNSAGSSLSQKASIQHSLIRTARWCMDGSTIMTTSEDRSIRLYNLSENASSDLTPYLSLPQPAPIISSLWYPTAAPSIPEGFCFAAAIRDSPVRLIDASTGLIRATYPIVDHRERFIAPYSMAWNASATKLYCGHENAIEVLDISAPGYDTSERVKTTQTRGDKGGQKGIISALAFSTDYSGMYAAGSFGGSVSLYSEDDSGTVGHLEGVEGGGVTQLAFHPLSPNHLFVASRRSAQLQVFDLRNPSEPFHSFPRSASTNQRMSFDLDPWGRYLAYGDEKGMVSVWDVAGEGKWGERLWESQIALENDAISSVQFHPLRPLLLTSSGSRHVMDMSDSGSESSSDEEVSEEGDETSSKEDRGGRGESRGEKGHRRPGPQLEILDFTQ